ncbi:MAG: phenylalanine--tRNA ligase subunit alpha [Planctomycetaceae bacterium]|jgi:phenylalanyl-tRNA synthetase alpha chain|nr:phenylalanine--tRNA ligase subunit alpha [Phycisphaerales bacterium]MCE2652269.1 phenylalanine--tRNA ligase subunit alpha [Planctomycetaceae bacterium]
MSIDLGVLETEARAALEAAGDAAALEAWRIAYVGPKGQVKAAMAGVKDVAAAERPAFGARVNALSKALEEALAAKRSGLGLGAAGAAASGPLVDVTEPGRVSSEEVGRRHILLRVREELVEVFARMGFEVAEGPELEDDEHNFVKLNIPPGHPARDPIDNFYIDDPAKTAKPRMLRSQTSTVQVRVMEKAVAEGGGELKRPIRIIAPGRVYRPDTVDATHSFMFHQIEGLAIERIERGADGRLCMLSMADLKSTLFNFARAYFGAEAEIRLRPTFFPFTEPSAELDLKIRLRPDQPVKWMELGGCGMVHPNVLRSCGVDPEQWGGFAFGFGIERLAMGKYGIPDIRMLFENDLRFLRQL